MSDTVRDVPSATLAWEIFKQLKEDPHKNSVPELAEILDAGEDQVLEVLSNYAATKDGPARVPDGQGHGWLSEEIAEQYRSKVEIPEFLGHRWPDGELRDEVFDILNDEHLAMMGTSREALIAAGVLGNDG